MGLDLVTDAESRDGIVALLSLQKVNQYGRRLPAIFEHGRAFDNIGDSGIIRGHLRRNHRRQQLSPPLPYSTIREPEDFLERFGITLIRASQQRQTMEGGFPAGRLP